jgi:hypothetical protein
MFGRRADRQAIRQPEVGASTNDGPLTNQRRRKLDPHVTAYSVEKIKKAIADKTFEKNDAYGIPIIGMTRA